MSDVSWMLTAVSVTCGIGLWIAGYCWGRLSSLSELRERYDRELALLRLSLDEAEAECQNLFGKLQASRAAEKRVRALRELN